MSVERKTKRKKELIGHLQDSGIVERSIKSVNEVKLAEAGFTENEISRIEKALAENVYDEVYNYMEGNLLQGNRIDFPGLFMLSPYQSNYDLKDGVYGGNNVSRKRNRIRIEMRKHFIEKYNQENFDGLTR